MTVIIPSQCLTAETRIKAAPIALWDISNVYDLTLI